MLPQFHFLTHFWLIFQIILLWTKVCYSKSCDQRRLYMCHCTVQDDGCEYERKRNDEFKIWSWKDWIEPSGNMILIISTEIQLLSLIDWKTNNNIFFDILGREGNSPFYWNARCIISPTERIQSACFSCIRFMWNGQPLHNRWVRINVKRKKFVATTCLDTLFIILELWYKTMKLHG